jgi:hypothetical protein
MSSRWGNAGGARALGHRIGAPICEMAGSVSFWTRRAQAQYPCSIGAKNRGDTLTRGTLVEYEYSLRQKPCMHAVQIDGR